MGQHIETKKFPYMAMKNLERGTIFWSPLTKEQIEAKKLFEEGIKSFNRKYSYYDDNKTSNTTITGHHDGIPITKIFFGNNRVLYFGDNFGNKIPYNFIYYIKRTYSITYIRTRDGLYHEIHDIYHPTKPIYDPDINYLNFFNENFFINGYALTPYSTNYGGNKTKAKTKAKPKVKSKAKSKAKLIAIKK